MRLGTRAMRAACARAGDPQDALRVVHVAGTNGKGSVSAMVEAAGRAAGLRTGLYTSPHLCRFAERIRVDGEPEGDDALASYLGRALAEAELSFFEVATLAALLAFRDRGVELAVLEVGIGGRLDATNVVARPAASAITRVALDHTDKLGRTTREIAWEKAHVAKPGAPLVLGPLDPDALGAARRVAEERGARVVLAMDDGDAARFAAAASLALAGDFQRDNARVAHVLCAAAGLPRDASERGIAAATWPGRLEAIDTAEGRWLLDGAHNPDGAAALARAIAARPERPRALVLAVSADKDVDAIVRPLAAVVDVIVASQYAQARSLPAPALAARCRAHGGLVECVDELAAAVDHARDAVGMGGCVIVAGSLFAVGEVRPTFRPMAVDPLVVSDPAHRP